MTALTIAAAGLPAPSQSLTEALSVAVRNATYAGPAMPLHADRHTRTEAKRRADLLTGFLAPLPESSDRIQRWLLELAKVKKFTPGDLEGAVKLMARFLRELPERCFTGSSLEAAAAKFPAWPDYAELKDFLAGLTRPVRDEIAALRKVAEAPEASSAAPKERTEAEKAYVQEQIAKLKRDLAAMRPQPKRQASRSHYLNDRQLIETYRLMLAEGRGNAGCILMRLEPLEARYGLAQEVAQ
ncbi:hypothetical protein [Roseomonas chloroacetimidivorans]|uniref:hypothetical protein n=1 Tax=Roseomonas chloroacetimidivorans TaxID=1766656 RepID=UPI003C7931FD